jgi:hypothetical protein
MQVKKRLALYCALLRFIAFLVCHTAGASRVCGHGSTVLKHEQEMAELRRRFTTGKPNASEKASGTLLRYCVRENTNRH